MHYWEAQSITGAADRFKDVRYESSAGKVIYMGCHMDHNAPTDDENWYIRKFTWDGDDCTRREGYIKGAWDDRATLGWA